MRTFSARELFWSDLVLRLGSGRGRILATVIPDLEWPNMYRVQMPGHQVSDMVNLARAKDAAMCLALTSLNVVGGLMTGCPLRPLHIDSVVHL
jgi:hypothetical protein